MPGLFDVGKSALQSYRQQLAVTGQNIANINTEGYKRRDAALEEISGSQGGITSISNQAGLGVRVQEIRRAFDSYVIDRSRSAHANFEASDALLNKLSELEDIILPQDANLGTFIGEFFNSLQEVATAPGDIAPRVVAIETGKSLAESFQQTASVVTQLQDGVFAQTQQATTSTNVLLNELTNINESLMSSGQTGSAANSLLDTRDRVIDEISKFVEITTDLDSRGAASLRLGSSGNGPLIVNNDKSIPLSASTTFDGIQFSLFSDGTNAPTSQVINGTLKGLSDAYTLIKKTLTDVDEMAFTFSKEINQQHKQGLDLNNEKGKDLFASAGFSILQNPTNTSKVSAEAVITNILDVSPKSVSLIYEKEADLWKVYDEEKNLISSGKNSIILPGYQIKLSGTPNNGDEIFISPASNFSNNLQFTISKPESIAAASTQIMYADTNNKSTSDINASKLEETTAINIPKLSNILTNSLSSISASEFYNTGAIGYIPQNVSALELVSLEQQPQVKFSLTDTQLKNASSMSFTRATPSSQTYQFNIAYADVFTGETGTWSNASDIAKYLNQGILTTASDNDGISTAATLSGAGNLTIAGALTSGGSATFNDARGISILSVGNDSGRTFTITGTDKDGLSQTEKILGSNNGTSLSKKFFKTVTGIASDGASAGNISVGVTGLRLSDLGVYASGNAGNLSLALSNGTLASTTPQIISSGTAVTGSIENRANASNIQIFTREGRHVSGTPLTDNEINTLLTSANGFVPNSEYRADYLNGYGESGYRGIEIERTNKTADSVITIGPDGGSARAYSGTSLLPDSPTEAWSLTVGGAKIINLEAGSSAGFAANVINKDSSKHGVVATASNRVELLNNGDSGSVKFKLSSKDTSLVDIEARVSTTSMKALAEKINLYSSKTGVSATVSSDQKRLVMESKDGSDINISAFDFDGNAGKTITATVVDKFSKATSSSVELGGNLDETKFTMTDNQIAKASTMSFTLGSTLYNFDISYQSAHGTAGEWSDVSQIAKYLNRGTLAYSDTDGIVKGTNLGSAGNLAIDGDLTTGGRATFNTASTVSIISAGNDSSRTFTITGTDENGVYLTDTVTGANSGTAVSSKSFKTISSISSDGATAGIVSVGLTKLKLSDLGAYVEGSFNDLKLRINERQFTPDTGGISAAATLGGAGNLTLGGSLTSGGLASFALAKTVSILSVGNDSGRTFTVTGTDASGNAQTETITGANVGTAKGSKGFKTITSISSDGATAGNVSVGLSLINPKITSTGLTDTTASIVGSQKIGTSKFSGTLELISPDNFSVSIDTQSVSSSIDTRQNSLITVKPSSAGDKNTLNFNALEGIDANGADKDGLLANAAASSYTVTLPNTGTGTSFSATINSQDINPVTRERVTEEMTKQLRSMAPLSSLSGAKALSTLPDNDDSVVISYDKKYYKLTVTYADPATKINPEISISGGEHGRITAYFDSNKRLQLSAPEGSLSGAQFSIIGNSIVSGNESAGKRFGLTDDSAIATRKLTGRQITLPTSTKTLSTTLNGSAITVTITPNGSGAYTLSTSNTNIVATFADTGTATTTQAESKVILTTNENSGDLLIPSSTDAENNFGIKVSNYSLESNLSNLVISSTDDSVVAVTTATSSIADQRIKLSNLPQEELIVLISGAGANRITANYDIGPEAFEVLNTDMTVQVMDDTGSLIEILDTRTGHSIATRSLNTDKYTEAAGYSIQLSGKAEKSDKFYIASNTDGTGDSRNIDALLKLQNSSSGIESKGNFQKIFSSIVSRVGSTVQSSELKQKSAEALRDTAVEFESQFSGVNLDEEAANLIEQQQAYQASARILSTARELFDTLLESV